MNEIKNTMDVLLVEDNPGEAKLVISAFEKCNPGKSIAWVDDGEKALRYLMSAEFQDTSHAGKKPLLVLLDLSLPKMGGIEVLQKIQESKKGCEVEIIVITGSQKESDRAKSYAYGVKTYMKKDIVCANCVKMISGELAEKCVAKAFYDFYE